MRDVAGFSAAQRSCDAVTSAMSALPVLSLCIRLRDRFRRAPARTVRGIRTRGHTPAPSVRACHRVSAKLPADRPAPFRLASGDDVTSASASWPDWVPPLLTGHLEPCIVQPEIVHEVPDRKHSSPRSSSAQRTRDRRTCLGPPAAGESRDRGAHMQFSGGVRTFSWSERRVPRWPAGRADIWLLSTTRSTPTPT